MKRGGSSSIVFVSLQLSPDSHQFPLLVFCFLFSHPKQKKVNIPKISSFSVWIVVIPFSLSLSKMFRYFIQTTTTTTKNGWWWWWEMTTESGHFNQDGKKEKKKKRKKDLSVSNGLPRSSWKVSLNLSLPHYHHPSLAESTQVCSSHLIQKLVNPLSHPFAEMVVLFLL